MEICIFLLPEIIANEKGDIQNIPYNKEKGNLHSEVEYDWL